MRALAWYLATRALGLAPLVWPETVLLADVTHWVDELHKLGPTQALPEYPWLAVLLAYLPIYADVPTILHYYATIVLGALALDALFAWTLWRAGGRVLGPGLALWLVAFPALGPLWVTRLDLAPTVLAAAALLASSRERPGLAGTLTALGAGLKLWPATVLPALLLRGTPPQRQRVLVAFGLGALALAFATVAAAGAWRLWSPLQMQGARGLQIEAFAALPLLWLRFFAAVSPWSVQKSEFCNCHEIYGPGVHLAIALAMTALLAAAAGWVTVYARALRAPPAARNAGLAALLTTLAVLGWVMTGRVFSPQYMIWLAGPLAVAATLRPDRIGRGSVVLFGAACLLTHLVFPYGYEPLIVEHHLLQAPALVILTARDVVLMALAARLAVEAWRATGAAGKFA